LRSVGAKNKAAPRKENYQRLKRKYGRIQIYCLLYLLGRFWPSL
jgi:hypothetical protein